MYPRYKCGEIHRRVCHQCRRALLAPRAKRDDEPHDAFRAYLSLFVRAIVRASSVIHPFTHHFIRANEDDILSRRIPFIPSDVTSPPPRVDATFLDPPDASPSPRARTLYSNKTGNTALQNVGRNDSGFSCRRAHSVLAPLLCVVNEICASLRHFPIVRSSVMARGRDARRGVPTRRFVLCFIFFPLCPGDEDAKKRARDCEATQCVSGLHERVM